MSRRSKREYIEVTSLRYKKALVKEKTPSWTNSVPPVNATANMLSEYCEVEDDLSNPTSRNGEGLLFSLDIENHINRKVPRRF